MAFCKYCGVQNDDGAAFCQGCGASLTGEGAPAATAAPAAKRKNPAPLIGIAVAVIAILAVIFFLFRGGSSASNPEDAAVMFVEAIFDADGKTVINLFPDEFVDAMCDIQDISKKELVNQLNDTLEYIVDDLNDQYGKKWSVDVSASRTREMDADDVEDLVDRYDWYYDIDLNVKAAASVRLDLTAKINGEKETEQMEITVIQVGNKWYVDPDALTTAFSSFYF